LPFLKEQDISAKPQGRRFLFGGAAEAEKISAAGISVIEDFQFQELDPNAWRTGTAQKTPEGGIK